MYELLQRTFVPSDRMSADGQPVGPAMVEGEPKFLSHAHSLRELAEAFEALDVVASLKGDDPVEDNYLARDLETGRWLTPYDVAAQVDLLDDEEDEDFEDEEAEYVILDDEDDDLPF